ncbi:MAG: molybdopterin oxidoreductase family protein, partial [Sandaracinaceae bacterium]
KRCGADWHYDTAAEVYAELARHAPKFAGMSHERIEHGGLQWPCPTPDHPGTKYLHEGGVLRGKGLFQAVEYRPSKEAPDVEYPLVLSTGRTLYHYNAATQTRRETGLHTKQSSAFIEMHPRDAKMRGIETGELVEVTTRRGKVRCRAIVSRQVKKGCIWMPLHFPDARANLLTIDEGDPITGTAEYKVCAAEVHKIADDASRTAFPGSFYEQHGPY